MNVRGDLPSGTVSLLFSDVEGSTLLLHRLGRAYVEAVDEQRRVQRAAWGAYGGTELGTEGDSFFVVFPTAEGAVGAAVQAQRELASSTWPGGEQLRVRMGIHTGTPTPHDGSYVGMDVHLAARIAGAAHGGQVLLSHATVALVLDRLPEGVTAKDLGRHQLKDITSPEQIFQLSIAGLPDRFPPIRTLGAASSLPRAATPLVGRDGELAELTALLSSTSVRLLTLTGPGGTGKTRLGIAVAERLVERFGDGVYFVPLAAVTTADDMVTTIAQALDMPAESRTSTAFYEQVAHRRALFVLDNLEQIDGADIVIADLLDRAPHAVVIAATRRPLNVPGENIHAVPPLELPDEATTHVESSGAVQLFLQHARMAKAGFALTPANTGDVVDICRRLDGLPLAIELAAARTRLLSPAAVLARLDRALDLTATSSRTPSRQKTLRNTVGWSYDLLNVNQQAFFRRLAAFSGGADLDAIAAVTRDIPSGPDPLDAVGDLADASLVMVTEDDRGEPRVGMLETIRSYGVDRLVASGELDAVRLLHAQHYLTVAEDLRSRQYGSRDQYLATRRRFETEHDNFREALRWMLDDDAGDPERVDLALMLCRPLTGLWPVGGHYAEMRRWLERATSLADDRPSAPLAYCLHQLAFSLRRRGDPDAAPALAAKAVAMLRKVGEERDLADALLTLGMVEQDLGVVRRSLHEAASLLDRVDDPELRARVSGQLGYLEYMEGDFEAALRRLITARDIFHSLGDADGFLQTRANIADVLRCLGRISESREAFRQVIPEVLRTGHAYATVGVSQDYAALLAAAGDHRAAVRLVAAFTAFCQREDVHLDPVQQRISNELLRKTRAALSPQDWDAQYEAGRTMALEGLLRDSDAVTIDTGDRARAGDVVSEGVSEFTT